MAMVYTRHMKKYIALILSIVVAIMAVMPVMAYGPGETAKYEDSFDPEKFVLPEGAKVLVVAAGEDNCKCMVYVFERTTVDGKEKWELKLSTAGDIGRSGMSNCRHEGDGTTPIGVWMMNTPFGQKPTQEGFPANYVQVGKNHVWSDKTASLEVDTTGKVTGERVGSANYAGYYDYVIDAGYNKKAIKGKGSALFLHCQGPSAGSSSGCVKIPKDKMIEVMKLYGKYGDGKCFMAQAPRTSVSKLYGAYRVCNGLCPDGTF